MKHILICGYGNIGTHIYKEISPLEQQDYKIEIYDKYKEIGISENTLLNNTYNFAFICVPTEMKEDRECNTDEVENIVSKVSADIIIIKSTIPINFTKYLVDTYKKTIVFSPEFYGTTIHALNKPSFLILSGDKQDCSKVADLYHNFVSADFEVRYTDYNTAELLKYMENCYLGVKVTFCSEFYNIAKEIGVDYNELRELMVLDPRFGKSHSYIYPEHPYYDSHCLNKDIPALLRWCEDNIAFEPFLLKMTDTINRKAKHK